MKKKQISTTILGVTEKIIRRELEAEQKRWPPFCNGIFHQPKRPKNKK